jgi:ParB family chromosome partitioning protein
MAQFSASYQALEGEVEELRAKLDEFDGALATRKLDPRLIVPSRFANRDEASFGTKDFSQLKTEISDAGGNVQPIKVRPIPESNHGGVGQSHPPGEPPLPTYEIVFGHRRHRACLELGLPVLATVADIAEQTLFVEMERENRSRKDLSAWEQGVMYKRALAAGIFPSNRRLAEAIGRDLSDVGKALALASLPDVVVQAFASPLDLQFRFAKALNDAWSNDPLGVAAQAVEIQRSMPRLAAKEVFRRLVERPQQVGDETTSPPTALLPIQVSGRDAATIHCMRSGRMRIEINEGILSSSRDLQGLAKVIETFLSKRAR